MSTDQTIALLKLLPEPQKEFEQIGQGRYRRVYAVNDSLVLKVGDGNHNCQEYLFSLEHQDICATIFAIWAKDYQHLLMERATPLNGTPVPSHVRQAIEDPAESNFGLVTRDNGARVVVIDAGRGARR